MRKFSINYIDVKFSEESIFRIFRAVLAVCGSQIRALKSKITIFQLKDRAEGRGDQARMGRKKQNPMLHRSEDIPIPMKLVCTNFEQACPVSIKTKSENKPSGIYKIFGFLSITQCV